jgi:hypothetical protein
LAVGALPLLQGQWASAAFGGAVGLVVVGGWGVGTNRDPSVGVPIGAGLLAMLVTLFAVSQWPSDRLAAPFLDWLLCWMLLGAVVLAALLVEPAARRSNEAPRFRYLPWTAAVLPLCAVVMLCCCGYALLVVEDTGGTLRFTTRDAEVLPLPPTLRLLWSDKCAGSGSIGNCTAEFVVAATDGAGRAVVVERAVDHLRDLGWPLKPGNGGYYGARETAGILPWRRHDLWLYTDAASDDAECRRVPDLRTVCLPTGDSVIIYIDNA